MKMPIFVTAILLSLVMVISQNIGTKQYCLDNSTLYTEWNFNKVKDGVVTEYLFNETTTCNYGCYNDTINGASCNNSEQVNTIIYVGLFVVILFIMYWLYTFIAKML